MRLPRDGTYGDILLLSVDYQGSKEASICEAQSREWQA